MPDGTGAVGAGAYPSLEKNASLQASVYPIYVVIAGRRAMPGFGEQLTDEQIAAVVGYIRTQFGNDYRREVKAAEVAQLRATLKR